MGTELNDLLLVSGSRVEPVLADAPLDAAAGAASATSLVDSEGCEPVAVSQAAPLVGSEHLESASPLRVTVYRGSAPKCDRCWRHVPSGAPSEEGVTVGAWTYRGCCCPASCSVARQGRQACP